MAASTRCRPVDERADAEGVLPAELDNRDVWCANRGIPSRLGRGLSGAERCVFLHNLYHVWHPAWIAARVKWAEAHGFWPAAVDDWQGIPDRPERPWPPIRRPKPAGDWVLPCSGRWRVIDGVPVCDEHGLTAEAH